MSVYIYALSVKNKEKSQKKERSFKFDWVGGIDVFSSEFTSVSIKTNYEIKKLDNDYFEDE
ncbi:MAG TPA: hypothetical protein PKY56_06805 [Candidatus Kapabacteria bacterium]|nr:hypothetical protein [Candidatus Kapabacteria bacterium]HPO62216.1 hypothetical protein [Candidatus Kapabacteria bacterium]